MMRTVHSTILYFSMIDNLFNHIVFWLPTFFCSFSQLLSRLHAVPHTMILFSLQVLGSFFYTAEIWIVMYDTNEWLTFSFFSFKEVCVF